MVVLSWQELQLLGKMVQVLFLKAERPIKRVITLNSMKTQLTIRYGIVFVAAVLSCSNKYILIGHYLIELLQW
jgi:hypothetical protein